MEQNDQNIAADIPSKTFQKFLEQLKVDGISADVIESLRLVYAGGQSLNEAALRVALFLSDEDI